MLSAEPVERSSSTADLVALAKQRIRKVGPDESGPARDQNSHSAPLLIHYRVAKAKRSAEMRQRLKCAHDSAKR